MRQTEGCVRGITLGVLADAGGILLCGSQTNRIFILSLHSHDKEDSAQENEQCYEQILLHPFSSFVVNLFMARMIRLYRPKQKSSELLLFRRARTNAAAFPRPHILLSLFQS
jgi:hypothetical protein